MNLKVTPGSKQSYKLKDSRYHAKVEWTISVLKGIRVIHPLVAEVQKGLSLATPLAFLLNTVTGSYT